MSSYQLVTPPTCEPVDVGDARAQVVVVDESENVYLRGLLAKARRYVEGVLSRQLITATWRLWLDAFPRGGEPIEITKPPVQSIVALQYVDAAGVRQTLSAQNYQTDLVSEPGRVAPAYGTSWPVTRTDTLNAVSVEFTAGYGTTGAAVPETIRHAIELLVAHWHEFREPIVTGTIVNAIPFTVDSLLTLEGWGRYP